jgi:hypothetical protein
MRAFLKCDCRIWHCLGLAPWTWLGSKIGGSMMCWIAYHFAISYCVFVCILLRKRKARTRWKSSWRHFYIKFLVCHWRPSKIS